MIVDDGFACFAEVFFSHLARNDSVVRVFAWHAKFADANSTPNCMVPGWCACGFSIAVTPVKISKLCHIRIIEWQTVTYSPNNLLVAKSILRTHTHTPLASWVLRSKWMDFWLRYSIWFCMCTMRHFLPPNNVAWCCRVLLLVIVGINKVKFFPCYLFAFSTAFRIDLWKLGIMWMIRVLNWRNRLDCTQDLGFGSFGAIWLRTGRFWRLQGAKGGILVVWPRNDICC